MGRYKIPVGTAVSKIVLRLNSMLGSTLFVVDENGRLVGSLGLPDIRILHDEEELAVPVEDVCNKFPSILTTEQNPYYDGRNIFLERHGITVLPIINSDGVLVDLFFRYQAFFSDAINSPCGEPKALSVMPYKHYAYSLLSCAKEALALGYDRFSAIEFGVAGGNGLAWLERYAREVERYVGVGIDTYGFDCGEGLAESNDYRDIPYIFCAGDFKMDQEKLQRRLDSSRLVIGDILETLPGFCPVSRVGVVLCDVDYYSSAIPVLEFFADDDTKFMPRVYLYFDDLPTRTVSFSPVGSEFQGESLAIKEFNAKSAQLKISPEATNVSDKLKVAIDGVHANGMKVLHRFSHPDYCKTLVSHRHHGFLNSSLFS
jgi:CBS domain-containing protein